MAGLYIHIPYCRKACHYCDFHFSTNFSTKSDLIKCLIKEITLKAPDFQNEIETIYFGGGTPSILSIEEIKKILNTISKFYSVKPKPEITLEANPEDLTKEFLYSILSMGVNRLSIGTQTFNEDILNFINRSHRSDQSLNSIVWAQELGFNNISADLIYGIPGSTVDSWKKDLKIMKELHLQHLSIYGLTIEEKTVFGKWHAQNKLTEASDSVQIALFRESHKILSSVGFEHYEVSNYAQPGFESIHNSSYWNQEPYLGFGPGAHSYNNSTRTFNIRQNAHYIKALKQDEIPQTKENLSQIQAVNEYIMVKSRTSSGIDLAHLKMSFGRDLLIEKAQEIQLFVQEKLLIKTGNELKPTLSGMLMADEIALKLFYDETKS